MIGLFGFIGLLVFQIHWWRRNPAARGYIVLFAIFLLGPIPLLAHSAEAFWVAFCLALNYLAIFPAFQASSPTLVMLYELWREEKVKESELRRLFEKDVMMARLEDLRRGKFVGEKEGKLFLTRRGKCLAGLFQAYRVILGLPVGDGG